MTIRHTYYPVVVDGGTHWHHWIITEYPLNIPVAIGSDIHTTYELLDADSKQVTSVSAEAWERARETAGWVLAPVEYQSFKNLIREENGSIHGTE